MAIQLSKEQKKYAPTKLGRSIIYRRHLPSAKIYIRLSITLFVLFIDSFLREEYKFTT